MHSLKAKLTVGVAASVVVLTAIAGLSLYVMVRAHLVRQFDLSLQNKARLLASTVRLEGDGLELEFEELDMSEFAGVEAGGYLQIWLDDTELYRSPSLHDCGLPGGAAIESNDGVRQAWIDLPRGRRGRALTYQYWLNQGPSGESVKTDMRLTVSIARDSDDLMNTLRTLQVGIAAVSLMLAITLSLLIGWLVNRAMRPVEALARQVGELDERSLNTRIAPSALPSELEPILQQFNGLLDRLQQAFERERTFSADMAHELRTPLSGLRTMIEVARAKPRSQQEHAVTLGKLLDVTQQMQTMVEGLLHLASLERGQLEASFDDVRIDGEIEAAWQAVARNGAANKPFELRKTLAARRSIRTDPALLNVALRNVLHNAATYVDDDGVIELASSANNGHVEIRVSNTGSRVAADDASHVFDRFWRADRSRARTGAQHGFGLGLPLSQLAVRQIGGDIRAESEAGGRFRIAITLPLKTAPP